MLDIKFHSHSFVYEDRTFVIDHDDFDDHIFQNIRRSGSFYERELLEALRHLIRPGDLVLDVGANIGNHALFFAGVCGARVIAFEANPRAARILLRNVERNGLCELVTLHAVGVSDRSGEGRVVSSNDRNLGTAAVVRHDGDGRADVDEAAHRVALRSIDDFSISESIRLIKIDVEGMEAEVLAGARQSIERDRPIITMEARSAVELYAARSKISGLDYEIMASLNYTPTHILRSVDRAADPAGILSVTSELVSGQRIARYESDQTAKRLEAALHKLRSAAEATHARIGSEGDGLRSLLSRIDGLPTEVASLLQGDDAAQRELLSGLAAQLDEVGAGLSSAVAGVEATLSRALRDHSRALTELDRAQSERLAAQVDALRASMAALAPTLRLENAELAEELRRVVEDVRAAMEAALLDGQGAEARSRAAVEDKLEQLGRAIGEDAARLGAAQLTQLAELRAEFELALRAFNARSPARDASVRDRFGVDGHAEAPSGAAVEDVAAICFYAVDLRRDWAGWRYEQAVTLHPGGRVALRQGRSTPGIRSGPLDTPGGGLYAVDLSLDFDMSGDARPFLRVQSAEGELLSNDTPLRPGANRVRFFQPRRVDGIELKVLVANPFDGFAMQLGALRLSLMDVGAHQRYVRRLAVEPVIASMASIPSRREMLADAVGALLGQCDEVRVFLNDYPDVPEFLRHPRVRVRRSQDFDDIGDAGKFGWIDDDDPPGYRIICDDDLLFPPDLVERLVAKVAETGRRAAVGLHGVMIRQPVAQYYAPAARHAVHFQSRMDQCKLVQILATCVMCVHSSALRMRHADFFFRNMADVWLAKYAQQEKLPLMIIDRPWSWVRQNSQKATYETIYDNSLKRTRSAFDTSSIQDAVLKSLHPLQIQRLDRRLCVFAAIVRTKSGLERLSQSFAKTRDRHCDWIQVVALASDDDALWRHANEMPFEHDLHIVQSAPFDPAATSRALFDLLSALDFDFGFIVDENCIPTCGDWCTPSVCEEFLEAEDAVALSFDPTGRLRPSRLGEGDGLPDYAAFRGRALAARPEKARTAEGAAASPGARLAAEALRSCLIRAAQDARRLPAPARRQARKRAAATVNGVFERVVVINLDRRPDRWRAVQEQLSAAGVSSERVRAVDGRWPEVLREYLDYATSPLRQTGPAVPLLRSMASFYLEARSEAQRVRFLESRRGEKAISSFGAWGYLKTMISILETAIVDGVESVLILDDDVRLHKDFRARFAAAIAEAPEDWLILQLGSLQYDWDSRWVRWRSPRLYSQLGAAIGSHAVGLRREVLPFLLERSRRLELPYDIGPLSAATRAFPDRNFVVYPNLMIQGISDTDIGSSDVLGREAVANVCETYRWDMDDYAPRPKTFDLWRRLRDRARPRLSRSAS